MKILSLKIFRLPYIAYVIAQPRKYCPSKYLGYIVSHTVICVVARLKILLCVFIG